VGQIAAVQKEGGGCRALKGLAEMRGGGKEETCLKITVPEQTYQSRSESEQCTATIGDP
jgi:hypothetical protein